MTRTNKYFGLWLAFALAAFALASGAAFADDDKSYTVTATPNATAPGTSPATVVLTLKTTGNSTFKAYSVVFPTSGYTVSATNATASNGSITPVAGGLQVSNINLPVGAQTETVTLTIMGVTTTGACGGTGVSGTWTVQPWTGSTVGSGTKFKPSPGSATTSIRPSCAKLTVTKAVVNTGGGTKGVADFPLKLDTNTPLTSGTQITTTTGTHTVSATGDAAYTASFSADCAGGSITLAAGDVKSCTITNTFNAPKLTVTKAVVNTGGGTKGVADFPLKLDTNTPLTSGTQITTTTGTHTVSETGDAAYTASFSADCAGGSITLAAGDVKSCTITNTFNAPKLTVTKAVVNTGGGTKGVADFPLKLDTNTPLTSGTQITTTTGTHTVSETGDAAYTASFSADCAGGSITLAAGDVKSCTITNTFKTFILTYTAGAGGTVNNAASVTQTVGYGQNGSAVTATANPSYRFVKWTPGDSTDPTRTDTNITTTLSLTANFGGTLSFTTPPHGALAGGFIGPVVIACNNIIDSPLVTISIDQGGVTGNTAQCVSGVATFPNIATTADTLPGDHTFTAMTNDYPSGNPATATTLITVKAKTGILYCDDGSGNPPPGGTTTTDTEISGLASSTISRKPNKDGSPCVAVPYVFSVDDATKTVTVIWDELAQPNAVIDVEAEWPPELVDPVTQLSQSDIL